MNIGLIDKTIREITRDEDAYQDVWVKIIEQNIEDLEQIKLIARKKRHSPIRDYHFIYLNEIHLNTSPAMPIDQFNDGGATASIVENIKNRKEGYTPLKLRNTDVNCKYCGSEYVYRFGFYKGSPRYWCRKCKRKFKAGEFSFHKKIPMNEEKLIINDRLIGKSLNEIREHLRVVFGIRRSSCTIWRIALKANKQ